MCNSHLLRFVAFNSRTLNFKEHILFEDNHLLVVNKPAGVLVQSDSTGDKTLLDYAKDYLKTTYQKPGNVYCQAAHRIDRPVSGVVVLTKTGKATERMNELFRENKVQKTYRAIVLQKPKNNADTLIHWLRKDTRKHFAIAYNQEVPNAQRAELSFIQLANIPGETLLEVKPVTGRFHQIRAQLSKIGCTIKGDLKYGAPAPNSDASICLHSCQIEFTHPVKNELLVIKCDYPANAAWKRIIQCLES